LIDTLLGTLLPAWRPGFKIKEVDHPKFYFFDVGVTRALSNTLRDPVDSIQLGYLFETSVLHELKTAAHYLDVGGEFCYWATPSGGEIDFIWRRGKHNIGFEVKSSSEWKSNMGTHLKEFHTKFNKLYGIYLGDKILKDGPIEVLPFSIFIKKLYQNEILIT
jgi:predicted AAA+ superfamily ATPase